MKFLDKLIGFIYKEKCYICKNSSANARLCPDCYKSIEQNTPEMFCELLGHKVYCAGIYEDSLQKIIRGVKYHRQKALAFYQAKFMAEYLAKLNLDSDFQIIPVPMFPSKQKQRGYNHMDLVAEQLSTITGFDVNYNLIKRIKNTKPQYKLKRAERMQNLKGAFELNFSAYNDSKELLIIDDILTTGATLESIIGILNTLDNVKITCLTTSKS